MIGPKTWVEAHGCPGHPDGYALDEFCFECYFLADCCECCDPPAKNS